MLATIFFAGTLAVLIFGPQVHPLARVTLKSQILLSSLSAGLGAVLVWLLLSFLFGRIYCSTVCPVGTFSDIFIALRRKVPRLNKPFRYRERSKWTPHFIWVYVLAVILGISVIPFAIEPWNIARNIAATWDVSNISTTWLSIGISATIGIIAGLLAAVIIALLSVLYGRKYCAEICPLGGAMGLLGDRTVFRIEIDRDKCSSCGVCEDICPSECISVVDRKVDNSRCVRCFDCVAKCPDSAIRFQSDRNRPATPLFTKTKAPMAK